MSSNPFSRKRSPVDEARKRLDDARGEAADAARNIRDAADDVVKTLEKNSEGKRVPVVGAAAAAALGIGLYVAKRVSGSSEPDVPDAATPVSADAVTKPPVATGASA